MSPLNVLFYKLALTLHLIYQGVYTSIQFSYQGKPNIKWESTYIYMCRNYYPPPKKKYGKYVKQGYKNANEAV